MTDLRKAAEMALHALKFSQNMKRCFARAEQDYHEKIAPIAIEALRQALAQPEQVKRVCNTCNGTGMAKGLHNWKGGGKRDQPCWACHETAPAPPSKPWVSLTDEEIDSITLNYSLPYATPSFVIAIEAALRSKNNG